MAVVLNDQKTGDRNQSHDEDPFSIINEMDGRRIEDYSVRLVDGDDIEEDDLHILGHEFRVAWQDKKWGENRRVCETVECPQSVNALKEIDPLRLNRFDSFQLYSHPLDRETCPSCEKQTQPFWSDQRTQDYLAGKSILLIERDEELAGWLVLEKRSLKDFRHAFVRDAEERYLPVNLHFPTELDPASPVLYVDTIGVSSEIEGLIRRAGFLLRVLGPFKHLLSNQFTGAGHPMITRTYDGFAPLAGFLRKFDFYPLVVQGDDSRIYGAPSRPYSIAYFPSDPETNIAPTIETCTDLGYFITLNSQNRIEIHYPD